MCNNGGERIIQGLAGFAANTMGIRTERRFGDNAPNKVSRQRRQLGVMEEVKGTMMDSKA